MALFNHLPHNEVFDALRKKPFMWEKDKIQVTSTFSFPHVFFSMEGKFIVLGKSQKF